VIILTQIRHLKTNTAPKQYSLAELNALDRTHFVRVVGPVFEGSPWIAAQAWRERPFRSRRALLRALRGVVLAADKGEKMALIRAHPDLAGRAARAGTLSAASGHEQANGGLDRLSAEEVALFAKHNRAYGRKFGFPFVICVRRNKKAAILASFERRLRHSREEEIEAALAEIFKIATLRLNDLVAP
jgi:2-oxo-4-hydroxy-4-carboxy-5-ureidoimidazoline decarboxylase